MVFCHFWLGHALQKTPWAALCLLINFKILPCQHQPSRPVDPSYRTSKHPNEGHGRWVMGSYYFQHNIILPVREKRYEYVDKGTDLTWIVDANNSMQH